MTGPPVPGRTVGRRSPRHRARALVALGVATLAACAPVLGPGGATPGDAWAPATAQPSAGTTPPPTPGPPTGPPAAPAATAEPEPQVEVEPTPTPAPGTALAAALALEVKGRAPRTGYDRDLFGPRWSDVDRNGCDTRNDVLARDLEPQTFEPGTHDCVVVTGTLLEPYGGATVEFRRGQGTSVLVQIDHVVALSDAWQKGAQAWDDERRTAFANDPLNLLAVDGALNQQKGDGDAATWLPPRREVRCAYAARQVAVKHVYGLWVTTAEQEALVDVLSACPEEPVPLAAGLAPGLG